MPKMIKIGEVRVLSYFHLSWNEPTATFLSQIRDTVGPDNIEVDHTVLNLLRQCAEEGDPVKLFHKLKAVLAERWPHLLGEFVPFLKPEQVRWSVTDDDRDDKQRVTSA